MESDSKDSHFICWSDVHSKIRIVSATGPESAARIYAADRMEPQRLVDMFDGPTRIALDVVVADADGQEIRRYRVRLSMDSHPLPQADPPANQDAAQ